MGFSRVGRLLVVVGLVALAAGCGSDDGSGEADATTGPGPTSIVDPTTTTAAGADCPNPEGGSGNTCLGDLEAGRHATMTLVPTLSYEVPDGWSNQEDLPGNFLLLPPGSNLAGVNPGTSDYLGVYSSVAAPEQCADRVDADVDATPQAMVDWLQSQPSLSTTPPEPVTVGGLSGIQLDVSFNDATEDACHDGSDIYADVIVGIGRSSLAHGVLPGYGLRMAFLANGESLLAIELADAPDGGGDDDDWWASAGPVIESFRFS